MPDAPAAPIVDAALPVAVAVDAAPAPLLDSPTLLGDATATKPEAPAEAKSSPVEPVKTAPDAKAQDAPPAEPAKADALKADDKAEGEKPKPEVVKAEEPAKEDKAETKPEGDKPEEVKAEAPAPVVYEAFTAPEGVKLDEAKVKEFTELVGPLQLKQEGAQALLDLYGKSVKDVSNQIGESMRQEQRQVWNDLNNGWKDELRSDTDLGGNRLNTTLASAKAVIEEYLSPEQGKRLLAHADLNGMSNFPEFIRLLHNVSNALNVFEDKIVPANNVNPNARGQKGFRRNYRGNGTQA